MAENIGGGSSLEAEIAELSRQIAEKKRALESASGANAPEREMISQSVAEHFYPVPVSPAPSTSVAPASDSQPAGSTSASSPAGADYLAALPPATVEQLNGFISQIPTAGIRATIAKVEQENPFILDAFHDALVTRLYDELKQRGLV
jgi:hypothetical protein